MLRPLVLRSRDYQEDWLVTGRRYRNEFHENEVFELKVSRTKTAASLGLLTGDLG